MTYSELLWKQRQHLSARMGQPEPQVDLAGLVVQVSSLRVAKVLLSLSFLALA